MQKRVVDDYKSKLRTAEEAAKLVKSGDNVYYSHFAMFPRVLDEALAKRVGEVRDVSVITVSGMHEAQIAAGDPEHKSFTYYSTFFSNAERQLSKKGLCFYRPSNYSEAPKKIYKGDYPKPNVVFVKTTPMDEKGYFNFGTAASYMQSCVETADKVVVEVNE